MKWVIIKGVRYPSSVISAFAAYNMDNPFLKVRIRNKYHIVPFDDVNKMASQMVYLMDNYPDFVQIGRWWISKKAVMSYDMVRLKMIMYIDQDYNLCFLPGDKIEDLTMDETDGFVDTTGIVTSIKSKDVVEFYVENPFVKIKDE